MGVPNLLHTTFKISFRDGVLGTDFCLPNTHSLMGELNLGLSQLKGSYLKMLPQMTPDTLTL